MGFFDNVLVPDREIINNFYQDNPGLGIEERIGMLAAAIVVFPLFLDIIDRDELTCPEYNYISYSLVYLLLPGFSVLMVNTTVLIWKIKQRVYPIKSPKEFFIRYSPSIANSIITFFATIGFSFIRGEYYACLTTGPETKYQVNATNLSYDEAFDTMAALSRRIGVCFSTVPVMFLCFIVIFFRGYSNRIETEYIFMIFVRMRDRFSAIFLRNELQKLAGKQAAERTFSILKSIRDSDCNAPLKTDAEISDFISNFLKNEYFERIQGNENNKKIRTSYTVASDIIDNTGFITDLAAPELISSE